MNEIIIYRVEVWGSFDSSCEHYEWIPLGDYHTNKEVVINELNKFRNMSLNELMKLKNAYITDPPELITEKLIQD